MGSKEETISELDFEFSQEELEEALKRKGGRPSNRTRELRARLKDAQQFTDIMGILNSGILERLDEGMGRGFRPSDIRGPVQVEDKSKSTPEGFTAELLLKTGLVNEKFISTNKQVLGLTDEVVSKALIIYGPVFAALAGLWIAEGQIKDMPKPLHTTYGILIQLLRLVDVLGSWVGDGLGGITDFVKDPIGSVVDPIQESISEALNLPRTEEEKAEARQAFEKKISEKKFRRG
jgi:hypothetical protein